MPTTNLAKFLSHFGPFKGNDGRGYQVRCPAHDDANPSLHISEKDGKILLRCFTGCSTDAIVAAVGLTLTDLFTPGQGQVSIPPLPFQRKPRGEPVNRYQYRNHDGKIVAEKGRFELPDGKKSFLWRAIGDTGWSGLELAGLALTDLALYGSELLEIDPTSTVYYCEGEKATIACQDANLVAVTFAGGASTKDFGVALESLRDRKVSLWPDNDAAGREYMAVVEARLRGVAASIRLINVAAPPKGDAFDYFASGGTVAQLEAESTPLSGPQVDFLGDDGIRVWMPSAVGTIVCTFSEIEKSSRSLDAEMVLEVKAAGHPSEPYTERINLLSASARESLRRELDNVYGKDFGWTRLLNTVFSLARSAYLSQDRSLELAMIEENTQELFFLEPLLPTNAVTILFGDGSSLKSFLAFEIAYCVATGRPVFGHTAPRVPVLIVDYEDNPANFRRRMNRIAQGHGDDYIEHGLIRYFPARGVPLRDLVSAITSIIREYGIGLLIVDSIGPACGGRPEDAEVGLAYARAIGRIGITSLHLAHVTKEAASHGQVDYPFGTVFWHNEARRTWFILRDQEEDSDDLDIGLYCKKVNDGPRPRPLSARVHFDGLQGAVTLTGQDIAVVPGLQRGRDLHLQIREYLMGDGVGSANAEQITTALNAKQDSVVKALARHPDMFKHLGQVLGGKGKYVALWGLTG